ncbi:MAG TPA: MobF family relaxase [Solirubrobacterales bacterium]|jgi:conjugative relaxase-like TrwC/TraI family protein
MLSIGKVGVGQKNYYLEKVAEGIEDYYSGEGEAQGYWLGAAAVELGLAGKVEPDQLGAILTGRNPVDGEPLGLKSAPGREPVPGFDLTFSAPKSVSLTWALGGHPVSAQVMEAHRAAVAEALSYMERSACWARRGKGGAVFVPGNGFLAAAYAHRSSRAGDPQLHTHVLVANATKGPDGRWSRLYHPVIYEHAKTASYIYEAHLRHELTQRLGVEWEPVRQGIADIKGFSSEELARFSTRRAEILAAAGPGASARAMQIATLETRKAKERDLTTESLREAWRVKGSEIGLTRETIALRLGHERPGPTVLTVEAVERSVTAHASHFERRDVIRAVADNLPHGAPASEIESLADAFIGSESVIEIAQSARGPRFTTERIWRLEQRALAAAERMHGDEGVAVVDSILVCRVLAARPSLKADQEAMVDQLLGGGRGLEVVIGEAGTGKTYATVVAAAGWAAGGYELQVAAPTWRAANVLRAEGLEAQTVAGLLGRLDARVEEGKAALARNSVLLVDEAGMVDSATLARLIDHADRAEAKLVLIGDPAQLGEIEAGGLFAAIARRSEEVRLDEVIRHDHQLDREAAKLIREGRGAEALDRYAREGRVVVAANHEQRREAIVADWWQAKERGEDALMIAKANSERERLNERARELMRAEGRLGAEEIEVGGRRFAVGEEVITRVNDQSAQIYNRERWRIESVDVGDERLLLAGIDTNRQVGVDPGYLRKLNPADGHRRSNMATPGRSTRPRAPPSTALSSWPTPRWTGRSSTLPLRGPGGRPSSTPPQRSASSGSSSRRQPPMPRVSNTSPGRRSATAPRPPPTTQRCGSVLVSSRPASFMPAVMNSPPRLTPRRVTNRTSKTVPLCWRRSSGGSKKWGCVGRDWGRSRRSGRAVSGPVGARRQSGSIGRHGRRRSHSPASGSSGTLTPPSSTRHGPSEP